MTQLKANKQTTLRFLILLFICTALSSCSNKVMFNTSRVVPAAEGYTKITKDDNGNKLITIEIKRLTQPTRLQPSRNLYVVWMDTKDNGLRNIGELRTGSGFFSSTLKSNFSTITPFTPKRIFITAENNADIVRPTGDTVLSTDRF
ncbi:hypothetical protein ABIB40_003818 [Pedobacter sp. UYP30]|uniref:hypothetical protein n=1 Tax=Pedobacter sp. UYP30 TaxID=1756400 RepID=UPI003395E037